MIGRVDIGVIGGSGVYQVEGAKVLDEIKIDTPFGEPSDQIAIVDLGGRKCAFLPRHGKGHRYLPTEIPVRANFWALKSLGVSNVLAISAVGSLDENYAPEEFVIPNQIIDRTKFREQTLFGDGIAGHVSLADPFCFELSKIVADAIRKNSDVTVHEAVTYLCMEGPAFSTRAESHLYRHYSCGIIGMTAIPEAKIAREAEMAYSMIAMVTDFDCWREEEEAVNISEVMGHMKNNVAKIKNVLPSIIDAIPENFKSSAHSAAEYAIMTSLDLVPPKTKKNLEIFYGKYWG